MDQVLQEELTLVETEDYITIPKTLIIHMGIAFIFFLLGGVLGALFGTGILVNNSDIFTSAINENNTIASGVQQSQPTAPPSRLDGVNVDDDPFLGPEDAPITIVEFSDYRCPYCKRFHDDTFTTLLDEYEGQIRFVYRDYPVVGGQQTAEAAQCAFEQDTFWAYHDGLFANPQGFTTADDYVALAEELNLDSDAFRECVESRRYREEVQADAQEATQYGVTGTPTFFINGVRLVGAQPIDAFRQIIDEELGP